VIANESQFTIAPAQLSKLIDEEYKRFGEAIRLAGLKVE
jgi:hypothetical protein